MEKDVSLFCSIARSLCRSCSRLSLAHTHTRLHVSSSLAPCVRVIINTSQARAVMARLQVDRRERVLMQHLNAKRVSYQTVTLPVGDVLCTYDEGGCTFLLERKRADDYAASIADGRWREQTARLFATGHRVFSA